MIDESKPVPCPMCMDQGLYTCKGHHETMTINASKLNPVPERDEVYESVKRGLEGGGSHDLGTFSDETELVPCSDCKNDEPAIISGGEFDHVGQCSHCFSRTGSFGTKQGATNAWNRLHGGARIEVDGCFNCPFNIGGYCHQIARGVSHFLPAYPGIHIYCPLRTVNKGPITIAIKEV